MTEARELKPWSGSSGDGARRELQQLEKRMLDRRGSGAGAKELANEAGALEKARQPEL